MITLDVQEQTRICLANSRRWFPELHERSTIEVAVHFALGLAGEIGELVEALKQRELFRHLTQEIVDEAADVAIYTLDLAGALRCPLTLVETDPSDDEWANLVVDASRAVDLVKKINRSATPWDELDLRRPDLTRRLAHVLTRVDWIVSEVGSDLDRAIAAKAEVCEARWGDRP